MIRNLFLPVFFSIINYSWGQTTRVKDTFFCPYSVLIVQDKDGYVNVRDSADMHARIIDRLPSGYVVGLDMDELPEEPRWVQVYYPSHPFSIMRPKDTTLENASKFYKWGYIHSSRLRDICAYPAYRGYEVYLRFHVKHAERPPGKNPEDFFLSGGIIPFDGGILNEDYPYKEIPFIARTELNWKGQIKPLSPELYQDLYGLAYYFEHDTIIRSDRNVSIYASDKYRYLKFRTIKTGNTYYIMHSILDGCETIYFVWVIRNGRVVQRAAL